jgi:hypothetical protein
MFLWNMLGALILIPALSYFLLRNRALERGDVTDETPAQTDTCDTAQRPGMPHAVTTSE